MAINLGPNRRIVGVGWGEEPIYDGQCIYLSMSIISGFLQFSLVFHGDRTVSLLGARLRLYSKLDTYLGDGLLIDTNYAAVASLSLCSQTIVTPDGRTSTTVSSGVPAGNLSIVAYGIILGSGGIVMDTIRFPAYCFADENGSKGLINPLADAYPAITIQGTGAHFTCLGVNIGNRWSREISLRLSGGQLVRSIRGINVPAPCYISGHVSVYGVFIAGASLFSIYGIGNNPDRWYLTYETKGERDLDAEVWPIVIN